MSKKRRIFLSIRSIKGLFMKKIEIESDVTYLPIIDDVFLVTTNLIRVQNDVAITVVKYAVFFLRQINLLEFLDTPDLKSKPLRIKELIERETLNRLRLYIVTVNVTVKCDGKITYFDISLSVVGQQLLILLLSTVQRIDIETRCIVRR